MLYIIFQKSLVASILLSCCLARAEMLACPSNAPPEWKAPNAKLDWVRVFGPSSEGMPEKEWQTGGTLFQTWTMKTRSPWAAYQVDCLYTGTGRFIRFDARSTAHCVAKRRVKADGLMTGSMEFRCR